MNADSDTHTASFQFPAGFDYSMLQGLGLKLQI